MWLRTPGKRPAGTRCVGRRSDRSGLSEVSPSVVVCKGVTGTAWNRHQLSGGVWPGCSGVAGWCSPTRSAGATRPIGPGVKLSDSEIQRRVITQAKRTTERGWLAEVPSAALVQSVNDSSRACATSSTRTGQAAGPAADEIQEGEPAVVAAHPQRISCACNWPVVWSESRRDSGALVARPAERTVLSHDHPRTRRALLRK
jgi:hypothetical protein